MKDPNEYQACYQELCRVQKERDRYRKIALEFLNHSCSGPEDEYGIRPCCNSRDFDPHKVSCELKQTLSGSEGCPHGLKYCVRCETEGKWSIGSEGETGVTFPCGCKTCDKHLPNAGVETAKYKLKE